MEQLGLASRENRLKWLVHLASWVSLLLSFELKKTHSRLFKNHLNSSFLHLTRKWLKVKLLVVRLRVAVVPVVHQRAPTRRRGHCLKIEFKNSLIHRNQTMPLQF